MLWGCYHKEDFLGAMPQNSSDTQVKSHDLKIIRWTIVMARTKKKLFGLDFAWANLTHNITLATCTNGDYEKAVGYLNDKGQV